MSRPARWLPVILLTVGLVAWLAWWLRAPSTATAPEPTAVVAPERPPPGPRPTPSEARTPPPVAEPPPEEAPAAASHPDPEAAAEYLSDVGLLLVAALDAEVDPADVVVDCSDDGRHCVLEGPLESLSGHHDLMGRIQEAIHTRELAPADLADLRHSRIEATPWEDGGPGFLLEVSLDPP